MIEINNKTPDKIFGSGLVGWFDAHHVNGLNNSQPTDGSSISTWTNLITGNGDFKTYTMGSSGEGSVTQPMIFELDNGVGFPHLKTTLTADKRCMRWISPSPTSKGCIIQIGKSYSFINAQLGGNANGSMAPINNPLDGGYIWQHSLPYLSAIGAASYYSIQFRALTGMNAYVIANGTNITEGQWYGHLPNPISATIVSGFTNGQSNPIRFDINNAPHLINISGIRKYTNNSRTSYNNIGFGGGFWYSPLNERFYPNLSATEFIYTNVFPTDNQMRELVAYIKIKYKL